MTARTVPYTEVTEFQVWVDDDGGFWEYSLCWRTPDGIKKSEVIRLEPEDLHPNGEPHRVIMAMYRERLWQAFEKGDRS